MDLLVGDGRGIENFFLDADILDGVLVTRETASLLLSSFVVALAMAVDGSSAATSSQRREQGSCDGRAHIRWIIG